MFTETVARDLRIGLRVLVKEKSFCALAVIVLALGICGVTTMFRRSTSGTTPTGSCRRAWA